MMAGDIPVVPSPHQYAAALHEIGAAVTPVQIHILRLHFEAPRRTITATGMSQAFGYSYQFANLHYGRLAHLVGEKLDFSPDSVHLGSLVEFEKRNDEWHWIMREELAQALEILGWVEGASLDVAVFLPEETAEPLEMTEGAVSRISVNAYERNPEARRLCIEHYGHRCRICSFDFGEVYGKVADGYIHVHHVRALSEIGREYTVDPVEDMLPVCPNCHAVIHRRVPAYTVEEVRSFLQKSE